ncbi:unnamed protein product [Protopolystoma xenopodis]|uniref:Uncharacterized protein n=1 Tax=Protopolystoma xenopodis TaxID=117903 RepID=A0A3S5FHE2_9PLAT|nr:unnamed protein product [Protopolystoma xenopodis]
MPVIMRPDDADGIAEREAEYNQLKLALHLAQTDRSRYVEEMEIEVSKMKCALILLLRTIDDLEKERTELIESISALDSKPNRSKDQRTCEDLANLAENKDWLDQQIALEKSKHVEYDAKAS